MIGSKKGGLEDIFTTFYISTFLHLNLSSMDLFLSSQSEHFQKKIIECRVILNRFQDCSQWHRLLEMQEAGLGVGRSGEEVRYDTEHDTSPPSTLISVIFLYAQRRVNLSLSSTEIS